MRVVIDGRIRSDGQPVLFMDVANDRATRAWSGRDS